MAKTLYDNTSRVTTPEIATAYRATIDRRHTYHADAYFCQFSRTLITPYYIGGSLMWDARKCLHLHMTSCEAQHVTPSGKRAIEWYFGNRQFGIVPLMRRYDIQPTA